MSTTVEEIIDVKNKERKQKYREAARTRLLAITKEAEARYQLKVASKEVEEAHAAYTAALREYAVVACGLPEEHFCW